MKVPAAGRPQGTEPGRSAQRLTGNTDPIGARGNLIAVVLSIFPQPKVADLRRVLAASTRPEGEGDIHSLGGPALVVTASMFIEALILDRLAAGGLAPQDAAEDIVSAAGGSAEVAVVLDVCAARPGRARLKTRTALRALLLVESRANAVGRAALRLLHVSLVYLADVQQQPVEAVVGWVETSIPHITVP